MGVFTQRNWQMLQITAFFPFYFLNQFISIPLTYFKISTFLGGKCNYVEETVYCKAQSKASSFPCPLLMIQIFYLLKNEVLKYYNQLNYGNPKERKQFHIGCAYRIKLLVI